MTPEFTQAFQQRLEILVADLRFFNKKEGTRVAPKVYKTMLPNLKEFVVGEKATEANYAPAICWGIDGGEVSHMVRHPIDVGLIGIISVDQKTGSSFEQIQSGSADIEKLAMAMKGLVDNCFYAGFKLQRPASFTLGLPGVDGDRGHPHPVYVLRYTLSFLTP